MKKSKTRIVSKEIAVCATASKRKERTDRLDQSSCKENFAINRDYQTKPVYSLLSLFNIKESS